MTDNTNKSLSLSPVQEQFWLQYQSDPMGSSYNMASLFEVGGFFDLERAGEALRTLVRRHEILRTVYRYSGQGPEQIVRPFVHFSLDMKEYDPVQLEEDIKRPFDLSEGPLYRFCIYRKKKSVLLLFVFHHIIIDLRSKDIFGEEFSKVYNSLKSGVDPSLSLSEPYDSYIEWLGEFEESGKYKKMLDFWSNRDTSYEPLKLSYDYERPLLPGTKGTRLTGNLSPGHSQALRRYCQGVKTYPFLVMLSAYYLLLHKFSSQVTVSLGIPRTNRPDEKFKNTLGCFVNILPMSIEFDNKMTFFDLLDRVRRNMLLIHRNQYVPYLQVVKTTRGDRDRKYNPLFQAGFTSEYPMELTLDGLTVEPMPIPGHGSQLDLFLYFWERNGVYHWELEYNTALFKKERAKLFVDSYSTLLDQILKGKDFPLEDTLWISEEWKQKVCYEWNATSSFLDSFIPVHVQFERQAQSEPNRTALIFDNDVISYGELNRKANVLANHLLNKGIIKEAIIGLSLERSFEMVIGLLAILKIGGSYLPLEPSHPQEYKKGLIEETGMKTLISKKFYSADITELSSDTEVVFIDALENPESENDNNPSISVDPKNRAYLFYTSGSTGKPKGVEIDHGGLADRIQWMDRTFDFGSERKTLLKTPYNFDVSGMEFWLPLTTGAPLVIARPEGHLDNEYMAKEIVKENISIIHFVPSLLGTFLKSEKASECDSLKDVLCCGEALPPSVVNEFYRLFPNARLHNLYGPTEATIFITYWKCENNCSLVPIGKPVANTQVLVLDENLKPVPPGVSGDLYLAGSGLARGYYKREDLTKSFFIENILDMKERMYKSGDLAQWSLDGVVHYLGRSDNQVQLHGQRIELGEIEMTLNRHPAIDSSAVVVQGEFGSEQRLIAFISAKAEVPSDADLRSHILRTLPKYMIPSLFIYMDELPLSANGKLDRSKLPVPMLDEGKKEEEDPAWEGELESLIGNIWYDTLKVKAGRSKGFFDLGGTSLQLMEVQSQLSRVLNKSIPVVDLFTHTTIEELARYLKGEGNSMDNDLIDTRVKKQKTRKMKRVRINER